MSKSTPKKGVREIHSDFLIIGSGLAGLYAALCASKFGTVSVLTKSTIEQSNSYWAQGGIAAAVDSGDSACLHMEDTMRAGRGLNNESAVKLLVEEGKKRIMDLIALGMKFDLGDDGLDLGLEGGHTKRRVLHAGGSSTGRRIIQFLIAAVENNPSIVKYESTCVIKILSDSKTCYGALALNEKFTPLVFISKSTVLVSGGASALYERTTNPLGSTGEGIALAYWAGAEITDMEFVQFHPTAFYNEGGESFLISEAVRGEGAYLLNTTGERFLQRYTELGELAPRDEVSRAIFIEMKKSGKDYVYLDLKHVDSELVTKRFSNIYELCIRFGINITKDLVPVAPAAHYTIGGVKTDLNGATNIKGLFACGEVACAGVHGANRLASNSLLECIVFAKRAIDGAIKEMSVERSGDEHNFDFDGLDYGASARDHKLFLSNRTKNANIMNRYVGIVRNKEYLLHARVELDKLSNVLSELGGYYSLKIKMTLLVSKLIAEFALLREESRGVHIRDDFPTERPEWMSHIILQKGKTPQVTPIS